MLPPYNYTPSLALPLLLSVLLPSIVAAPVDNSARVQRRVDSTGSLYGSEALLGNDGNPVDTADTAIVTDYQLAPGQDADADIGFPLDFTEVENPQPIRGENGAVDSGPRK